MSGRRSRNKGASFERRVAAMFKLVWPDALRGIGQARSASEVPDVDGTPLWVECKKRKGNPDIPAALKQARAATDGRPVVAVTAKDFEEPLVTMYLVDWLAFLHQHCYSSEGYENPGKQEE